MEKCQRNRRKKKNVYKIKAAEIIKISGRKKIFFCAWQKKPQHKKIVAVQHDALM